MSNKIRVTIDPGHSWNVNQGAIKTYYESNAMYDFAQQLKGALEKYGIFDVQITKKVLKENPTLEARAKMAVNNGSRVFFSLHTNACGTESVYRTVIYNSCKRKASESFCKKLATAIAGVYQQFSGQSKTVDPTYRVNTYGTDYYGILRCAVPTDIIQHVMLFEHDFHTNTKQCQAMLTEGFWEKMAEAQAKVVYDEMKQYYIGDSVKTYAGTVTGTLNVRSSYNASSQRIGSLSKGATVQIVSKVVTDDTWYKILYNGCAAWVAGWVVATNMASVIPNDKDVNFGLPSQSSNNENTDIVIDLNKLGIDYNTKPDADNSAKVSCADGLNVRTGPGTQYAKIETLESGTTVGVYHRTENIPNPDPMNGWEYILYNTDSNHEYRNGFVLGSYLDKIEDITPRAMVNCTAGLNYRNGPGTGYKKIGCLPYKTIVYTLGKYDNSWTKIRLSKEDKNVYYVSSQYLTEVAETDNEVFIRGYQDCDYGKAKEAVTIRSTPSTSGAKIGTLKKNSICCISALVENDEWARIICAANYGYVQVKYLDLIGHRGDESEYEVDPSIAPILDNLLELSASEWFLESLGAKISSPYGWRTSPISNKSEFHTGIDFACTGGTPIYSDVDGICTFNSYDSSCGNMCILLDEQGRQHRFYHMKAAAIPAVGKFVHAGELVGYVGTTGDSTGNHLHYEVRIAPWQRNNTIDPTHISFQ